VTNFFCSILYFYIHIDARRRLWLCWITGTHDVQETRKRKKDRTTRRRRTKLFACGGPASWCGRVADFFRWHVWACQAKFGHIFVATVKSLTRFFTVCFLTSVQNKDERTSIYPTHVPVYHSKHKRCAMLLIFS
jgi:hypothetical protein